MLTFDPSAKRNEINYDNFEEIQLILSQPLIQFTKREILKDVSES